MRRKPQVKQEEKTKVERFIRWGQNHAVISVLIIAAAVLGGVTSFTENLFHVGHAVIGFFASHDPDMRVVLEVKNERQTKFDLNPICDMELIETTVRGGAWYGQYSYRMVPLSKSASFTVPPHETRDYQIIVPEDKGARIVFERGVASATVKIYSADDVGQFDVSTPFNKNAAKTNKALVLIK